MPLHPLGQNVTAYLAGDSSTSPSSSFPSLYTIGTLNDLQFSNDYGPGNEGVWDFSGLSYELAADTRYWIVLFAGAGISGLDWVQGVGYAGVGVAGEYWYTDSVGYSVGNSSMTQGGPFEMSVTEDVSDVSSVPEPTSILLLASILGVVGWRVRRRAA